MIHEIHPMASGGSIRRRKWIRRPYQWKLKGIGEPFTSNELLHNGCKVFHLFNDGKAIFNLLLIQVKP